MEARSFESPDGGLGSKETALVTLPRAELERIWTPEYLERLARTYWRYLTRISLGILRVVYGEDFRKVVILTPPFTLLCFKAPEYEVESDRGSVTWRIDRGLLVAPAGGGKGFLRIRVERPPDDEGSDLVTTRVSSEVAEFHPLLAGWGWFRRIGLALYRVTQLRVHVLITHGFLRSLATLDLAPSVVGQLKPAEEPPRALSR